MTDLTLQEAINETQKFARIIKGLEKLGETAQAYQGADQVIAERTAKAAELQAQVDSLVIQSADAQASIAESKAAAKKVTDAAKAKAEAIVSTAEQKAAEAQSLADASVAAAKAELAQITDALVQKQALIVIASAELADVQSRTVAAREAARKQFEG